LPVSKDTCKLPYVSAQTNYEIVWQVYGDATACSKETHGGERGRRGKMPDLASGGGGVTCKASSSHAALPGSSERRVVVLLLPSLTAGENLQTLLLKEQRSGAKGMSKRSLLEVEDIIPPISPSLWLER